MTLPEHITKTAQAVSSMQVIATAAVTAVVFLMWAGWSAYPVYQDFKEIPGEQILIKALSQENAASIADLTVIAQSSAAAIADLQNNMRELSGEARVVQFRPGYNVVIEPVVQGQIITLATEIRRTETGASCQIVSAFPIFKDSRNAPEAGEILNRLRNFGTDWDPVNILMRAPATLVPGFVNGVIEANYDCAGRRVTETSSPFNFILLPRPAPEPD